MEIVEKKEKRKISPNQQDKKLMVSDIFMAIGAIVAVFFIFIGFLMLEGDYVMSTLYTILSIVGVGGLIWFMIYAKKQTSFSTSWRMSEYAALVCYGILAVYLAYSPISVAFNVMGNSDDLVSEISEDQAILKNAMDEFYQNEKSRITKMTNSVKSLNGGTILIKNDDRERIQTVFNITHGQTYSQRYLEDQAVHIDEIMKKKLESEELSSSLNSILSEAEECKTDVKSGMIFLYPEVSGKLKRAAENLKNELQAKSENMNVFYINKYNGEYEIEVDEMKYDVEEPTNFENALKGQTGFNIIGFIIGIMSMLFILSVYFATPRDKRKKNKLDSTVGISLKNL